MIKRIAQVAMASLMWVAVAGPAKAQDNKAVYVIDKKATHQVIDNFGASDAWRCDFIGKYWPEEKREKIADLLFKREFDEKGNPIGMALTNWRVNIGAGSYENREGKEVNNSWNRTECFLAPDGTYDFSKQAGQRWFMQAAKERGMNNFLFFANSAPYFMTRSGATVAADGKYINLREDKFDDFAQFLVTCAAHFRSEGYGVNYISPINEPNVEWHTNFFQEGSFATRDDIFRMVVELDWALGKQKVDAKIIVPEMGELKCLFDVYEDENMPDDIIRSMFYEDGKYNVLGFKNLYNCVAAHDYWTAYPPQLLVDMRSRVKEELAGNGRDTKFWASEYCILEKNEEITMEPSPLKSINLGLYVARIIHNDLAVANASAWQWWTAVSLGEDVPIRLLPMEGATSETVKYDGIIEPTKMFYTTANYSFFVRPGMKRIEVKPQGAEVSDLEAATSLMVSSYTDGREVVTVIINYTDEEKPMELRSGHAKKGKVYVTDIDRNLEFAGKQQLTELVIPARSVVTVVI